MRTLLITNKLNMHQLLLLLFPAGIPDLGSMAPSGVEKEPSAYEGCVRQLVVNGHNYILSERGE